MEEPASMSPGSIMPNYPWLIEDELDITSTPAKIRAMQTLGVPYPAGFDAIAVNNLNEQANKIAEGLKKDGIEVKSDREIIALIAYLQRMGTDIKGNKTAQN
jgi:cytochrome c oxidase cbb3-type subunit I/II